MTVAAENSLLELAYEAHRDKPFFELTLNLLRGVRDHDFDALAEICYDDYGIVDIAADGGSVAMRNRDEWAAWFRGLY
jgi:hypothetical protein